jgi:hypothetical protein
MVELAREAVPSARFAMHDCRHLADLNLRFDGIICAFGLPYLSEQEAAAFIRAAGQALEPKGVLYLSAMLGRSEDSGFQPCSTGDLVYVNYFGEDQVIRILRECGLTIVQQKQLPSPSGAPKPTTDLIVIAVKRQSALTSRITVASAVAFGIKTSRSRRQVRPPHYRWVGRNHCREISR